VSGCTYTDRLASVAAHISGKRDAAHDWERLGYDGAYDYKRKQRKKLKSETSHATIGWLTDSHIGKETGGYGNNSWDISPLDGFQEVTEFLGSLDLDSVVYTGDLFHNDKRGISNANQRRVESILESNFSDFLPIYYIAGNHARNKGRSVWSEFERNQIAEPLSTDPVVVENTAIYGIDYHEGGWWKQSSPCLQPTNAEYRILCLHQSVEPYRSASSSELDLRTRLSEVSRLIEGVPEFVLLGHLHEVIDDTFIIDGQEVRVVNPGATTRVGNRQESFAPSAGLVRSIPDGPQYIRISFD
jgi:DNA repair exonuclease SbcCD nuclease subunit